jgi:NAD(P)-dependent dehydrogenase (short-subunit alcohol dehydrogenase family)
MQIVKSLRDGYTAIVIGASGGIGSALAEVLSDDAACARVVCYSRGGARKIDVTDEDTVLAASRDFAEAFGEADLIFNATGALVIDDVPPEKTIRRLDPSAMARHFQLNAIGPALLIKHFAPLLSRDRRGLFASLSARVGSIGDNGLGGWYSYRASKAAQNQIIRTASIELARTHPHSVLAVLHPGTVATGLSEPFAADRDRLTPHASAEKLLRVLDGLSAKQSGNFFDYKGETIQW